MIEAPELPAWAALLTALCMLAGAGLTAPPLRPVPRSGDLPLSFAQQRLWFLQQLDRAAFARSPELGADLVPGPAPNFVPGLAPRPAPSLVPSLVPGLACYTRSVRSEGAIA